MIQLQQLASQDCWVQGQPIPDDVLSGYRESSPNDSDETLQSRLQADGYVFIRSAIDRDVVLSAREEVFSRLVDVGEIRPPAIDGIFTGTSRRPEVTEGLGDFWRSVSQGPLLRRASHGDQAAQTVSRLLGEPAQPHDYIFLRPGVRGRATHLHFDKPFFARGSNRIHTVWTALGDIPVEDGPLMVLENSHNFDDLISPVEQIDYTSSASPKVQMTADPIAFARERATRLLTANFAAGDIVVFTMRLMHGTLDNHSSIGRTRLSCDVRFQPASDPFDNRYMGSNPPGTTGVGYGELNGAKPLTEEWHTR